MSFSTFTCVKSNSFQKGMLQKIQRLKHVWYIQQKLRRSLSYCWQHREFKKI